jgi:hypothetical protein
MVARPTLWISASISSMVPLSSPWERKRLGCVAVGALFGIAMLAATKVGRDNTSGEIWVRAGLAYLLLWVVMLGTRIVFAYSATAWARRDIGHFFASNHLTSAAVTPAFVLMTIGSLVVVTIGTTIRAASLSEGSVGVPGSLPVA